MTISLGYGQLQPKFILGTGQWTDEVAEQIVGAQFNLPNQLREHFPFFELAQGNSIVVPRVEGLATAAFTDNETVDTDATVSKLLDPPEQVEMTALEGTVELTNFANEIQSYDIDQLDLHIELKKIAVRIAFWKQFFSEQQPRSFRGLPDLVAPDQQITTNELSLEDLDELVHRVTEGDAEMDSKAVVMNGLSFVRFVRLVRATGAQLRYCMFNGRRYAVHNGVPILISDYVPLDKRTRIWCMTLGLEDKGVFGVVPEDVGDSGLVVEEVQGIRGNDATVHRVRWYCSVVLGQQRGLASLDFDAVASGLI